MTFWKRYLALCATFVGLLLFGRIQYALTVDASRILTVPMLVGLVTVAAWIVGWLTLFLLLRLGLAQLQVRWKLRNWPLSTKVAGTAALLLMMLPLVISWGFYLQTGSFLTRNMLAFFVENSLLVLKEMRGIDGLYLGFALAMAIVLTLLLLRWSSPEPLDADMPAAKIRKRLAGVALAALIVFASGQFIFPALALSESRSRKYQRQVKFRSSPGLAFFASVLSTPASYGYPSSLVLRPREPGDSWPDINTDGVATPNVVLVIIESLRHDSLRATGSKVSTMPFLDALAERSLLFSNTYAQGSATHYTVPAILSSLYPLKLPGDDKLVRTDYPRTLFWDLLKRLGYRTGYFSSQNENWGNLRRYLMTPGLDRFFHSRDYAGATMLNPLDQGVWDLYQRGLLKAGYLDDAVTVATFSEWLGKNPADAPYLAVLNLQAAHFPYEMAMHMETPFRPNEIDFEASYLWYPPSRTQVMRNRYRNSLRYVDERLSDIHEQLAQRGELENTIFVVVGDHGEAFHEHAMVTHGRSLHQETVRIPLLIHAPGLLGGEEQGQVNDLPVQQIDIIPTLLGLMGLPSHPNQQGIDVLARHRIAREMKLFLCVQQIGEEYALVWNDYKYILSPAEGGRLYSLRDDPGEFHDLADEETTRAALYEVTLKGWISAQLGYYANPEQITRFYPPRY